MPDLASLALAVGVVAMIAGVLGLLPAIVQGWYDYLSNWPYSIENVGRLRSVVFGQSFMFRVFNHTSVTAYFAVRVGPDVDHEGRLSLVPHHLSTSPQPASERLLIDIPPRVWVDVRVMPFGLDHPEPPKKCEIGFIENSHWKEGGQRFAYPSELDKDSGINETDLTFGRPTRFVNL